VHKTVYRVEYEDDVCMIKRKVVETLSWTNETTNPEFFCLNMENHINVKDIRRPGGDSKGASPEYK